MEVEQAIKQLKELEAGTEVLVEVIPKKKIRKKVREVKLSKTKRARIEKDFLKQVKHALLQELEFRIPQLGDCDVEEDVYDALGLEENEALETTDAAETLVNDIMDSVTRRVIKAIKKIT